MKKTLLILSAVGVLSAVNLLAQAGPGPGGGTNNVNTYSNYYNYNYEWSTNLCQLSNAPAPRLWSNHFEHAFGGPGTATQWRNRFGQQELPADAQAMVQQFQQERQRLMSQLKTCSDEQRQQILRDMEQLRTQLRDQVCKIREQAQDQARTMQERFNNERQRMMQQGAGNNGTGGRDR